VTARLYLDVVSPHSKPRVLSNLLDDAREADIREWETAGWRRLFKHSLSEALDGDTVWSVDAWDEQGLHSLLAFGVNAHARVPSVGNAWLVATNGAAKFYSQLRKEMFAPGLRLMLEFFPVLHAWADSRNIAHHRWMKAMGFNQTDKVVLLGLDEAPFYLFTYQEPPSCASP